MKRTITTAALLSGFLLSCTSKSGEKASQFQTVRMQVLEKNTMSYAKLNVPQRNTLHAGDTVWLNLRTHYIDDNDPRAMMAVIRSFVMRTENYDYDYSVRIQDDSIYVIDPALDDRKVSAYSLWDSTNTFVNDIIADNE